MNAQTTGTEAVKESRSDYALMSVINNMYTYDPWLVNID